MNFKYSRRLVCESHRCLNIGFVFYLTQNPVGTLFLNLNINGTTYTSSTPIQITNQWYHIAVTVLRNVSSPIGIFYVNGQQVGTFTLLNGGPVSNNLNLWIGRSRISNNNCIIWIDELELFNRSLNASEIYSIWAADTCGKCKPAITSIGEFKVISSEFKLLQCYPNPFNPSTNIEFYLPKAEFVKLSVFNALGEEVAELLNRHIQDGTHKIVFDASSLPSGIYYYQLRVGEFVQTRKMILMR
jgi:hypothetical protein